MGIFETYTKRKKRELGLPEVYQYTKIPEALRIQVVHIWIELFGRGQARSRLYDHADNEIWYEMRKILAHERGVHALAGEEDPFLDCLKFVTMGGTDDFLEIVEFTFRIAPATASPDQE